MAQHSLQLLSCFAAVADILPLSSSSTSMTSSSTIFVVETSYTFLNDTLHTTTTTTTTHHGQQYMLNRLRLLIITVEIVVKQVALYPSIRFRVDWVSLCADNDDTRGEQGQHFWKTC